MIDPRVTKLAHVLCHHSCNLSKDDRVLIHSFDIHPEVVAEITRVVQETGAQVALRTESNLTRRQLLLGMSEGNARLIADIEKHEMERMTAYIAVRGGDNCFENSDVPQSTMNMWQREYAVPVVFETRVPRTKWVALRWPSPSMAQQAGLSTPAFERFYFDVCTLDYSKMAAASKPLKALMDETDEVRVLGPGTDIRFSIQSIGAVACSGERNIPDGECFTAPVRESVNGNITYNTVSLYQGIEFSNMCLKVKDGKVIEAVAGEKTHQAPRCFVWVCINSLNA